MTETVICPHCKAVVAADSRYCDQCSLPLGVDAPGAGPPPGPATVSQPVGPATVSQPVGPAAVSQPVAAPVPAKPAEDAAPKLIAPAVRPITTTLDRPPARKGLPVGLIIGLVVVAGLFLAAVGQAALLLNSRAVPTPVSQPGLDPTAAAALIQKQATALSIQQTTTAQFQAQATRLAEQPLAFQATLTAVSAGGTMTPTLTLSPAPKP